MEICWILTSNQIISNHIESYQIISNHIKSYRIISNHIKSYQIISNHIKSYQIYIFKKNWCCQLLSYMSYCMESHQFHVNSCDLCKKHGACVAAAEPQLCLQLTQQEVVIAGCLGRMGYILALLEPSPVVCGWAASQETYQKIGERHPKQD